MSWPGETATLRGKTFGELTVEAPALADAVGVRVLCRCACGRIAIRLVASLCSGDATMCRRCAEDEAHYAEQARLTAERDRSKNLRRVWARRSDLDPDELEDVRAIDRERKRALRDADRRERICDVPRCTMSRGRGRQRYCDRHGEMGAHELRRLMGRKPKHSGHKPRAGEPGWERERERAKVRRQERRASDPAFRELERRLAAEYRERKRARARAEALRSLAADEQAGEDVRGASGVSGAAGALGGDGGGA